MNNSILPDKSKSLVLEVIRLCNEVKSNKRETVLTNQLVRSGTSIGANSRETLLHIAELILLPNFRLH